MPEEPRTSRASPCCPTRSAESDAEKIPGQPDAPQDQGHDAYMMIGSISCSSARGCVALGLSDAGSEQTPVYSNIAGG
jgi:hypothetical protein